LRTLVIQNLFQFEVRNDFKLLNLIGCVKFTIFGDQYVRVITLRSQQVDLAKFNFKTISNKEKKDSNRSHVFEDVNW